MIIDETRNANISIIQQNSRRTVMNHLISSKHPPITSYYKHREGKTTIEFIIQKDGKLFQEGVLARKG